MIFLIIYILTQSPNATRNGAKFGRSLFRRKTRMTYLGKLPSIKLLGTLIPFVGLRFTELCSDWSKSFFMIFKLSVSFKTSNFSFYQTLMSVHSDKQCTVKKKCFSFLVFDIKIGFLEIKVSLIRKSRLSVMQNQHCCYCQNKDFLSCQPEK